MRAQAVQTYGDSMRLAALFLGLTLVLSPVPASAHHEAYYGDSAKSVAKHIGCKNFRGQEQGAIYLYTGVCWLGGKRVNVITFKGPGQQAEWNRLARYGFGKHFFWANGTGAVVVAKNGNRPAARVGARRLPGVVRHG